MIRACVIIFLSVMLFLSTTQAETVVAPAQKQTKIHYYYDKGYYIEQGNGGVQVYLTGGAKILDLPETKGETTYTYGINAGSNKISWIAVSPKDAKVINGLPVDVSANEHVYHTGDISTFYDVRVVDPKNASNVTYEAVKVDAGISFDSEGALVNDQLVSKTNLSKIAYSSVIVVSNSYIINATGGNQSLTNATLTDTFFNHECSDIGLDWNRTGLVSYWSFRCNNAIDVLGTNNGTVYGATWNATGSQWGDGAFDFDGVNDYVDCGKDSSLPSGDQVTVEAWIYPLGEEVSPQWQGIVMKGAIWNYNEGIALFRQHVGQGYRVNFWIKDGGVQSTTSFVKGSWYHVVGTYDGAKIRIYVNGIKEKEANKTGNIGYATSSLRIGYSFENKFNGTIDEVRIYNRSLSADEVNQSYLLGKDNFLGMKSSGNATFNLTIPAYSQVANITILKTRDNNAPIDIWACGTQYCTNVSNNTACDVSACTGVTNITIELNNGSTPGFNEVIVEFETAGAANETNATPQNEVYPTYALPLSTIKISGDLYAITALSNVYAYLNVPGNFTFVDSGIYPQNQSKDNFTIGQTKTATWYVTVPANEGEYVINITWSDNTSNTWQSDNMNIFVQYVLLGEFTEDSTASYGGILLENLQFMIIAALSFSIAAFFRPKNLFLSFLAAMFWGAAAYGMMSIKIYKTLALGITSITYMGSYIGIVLFGAASLLMIVHAILNYIESLKEVAP